MIRLAHSAIHLYRERMARTADDRTARVGIRVASDEVIMLRQIARSDGLDMSSAIRALIRRTHRERFGQPPTSTEERTT